MERDSLERMAQENVCTCFHFDLANAIEDMEDAELQQIINNPQAPHYQQQLHQPVSVDEFIDGLLTCTSYKSDIPDQRRRIAHQF